MLKAPNAHALKDSFNLNRAADFGTSLVKIVVFVNWEKNSELENAARKATQTSLAPIVLLVSKISTNHTLATKRMTQCARNAVNVLRESLLL